MPKQKTHKGASKRFSLTGTGKVKRKKAFHSHILTKKTTKRKRKLRASGMVAKPDAKNVKKMLNYK